MPSGSSASEWCTRMVAASDAAATDRTPSKYDPPAPTLGGPPMPPPAGCPAMPGWKTNVSSASISVFFGKFCVIGR